MPRVPCQGCVHGVSAERRPCSQHGATAWRALHCSLKKAPAFACPPAPRPAAGRWSWRACRTRGRSAARPLRQHESRRRAQGGMGACQAGGRPRGSAVEACPAGKPQLAAAGMGRAKPGRGPGSRKPRQLHDPSPAPRHPGTHGSTAQHSPKVKQSVTQRGVLPGRARLDAQRARRQSAAGERAGG